MPARFMSLDSENTADGDRDDFEDNLDAAQRQLFNLEVNAEQLRTNFKSLKAAFEDRKEQRGPRQRLREEHEPQPVRSDLQSDDLANSWTPISEPTDAVDAIAID